ncbi:MAG: hypothetical protein M2R45_04230 [Verrucomicrobia subdivision 3 bacterium]|nr:hypothetical protein [Limisphaerales bacterium]MCS1417033.1 hypothetical protein [Limisphaerales bacterium]
MVLRIATSPNVSKTLRDYTLDGSENAGWGRAAFESRNAINDHHRANSHSDRRRSQTVSSILRQSDRRRAAHLSKNQNLLHVFNLGELSRFQAKVKL